MDNLVKKPLSKQRPVKILAYLIILVLAAFIFTILNYDNHQPLLPQWAASGLAIIIALPACYFAANRLVPNYLYQKKIRRFAVYFLLLALANTVFTYLFTLFIYHVVTGLPMFRSISIVIALLAAVFLGDVIFLSISCLIKIITDRYFMEQQLVEVENEKINTELNFLRAQVNPHFLFNVMNTIYFQIDKKNIDARASVEKFSEMLRYQLYECTTDKIDIVKEVDYLKNYVALQTLRMENGTDIQLCISPNLSGFSIAPLLLLPIIENAFKHISNFKEAGQNKIKLTIKTLNDSVLWIETINTFDSTQQNTHLLQPGGLGIQNLKRRLQLLYPNKHEFSTIKEASTYCALLKLQYHG